MDRIKAGEKRDRLAICKEKEEVWHQEDEQGREQEAEGEDGREDPDITGKS